jgi:hypothetical protein
MCLVKVLTDDDESVLIPLHDSFWLSPPADSRHGWNYFHRPLSAPTAVPTRSQSVADPLGKSFPWPPTKPAYSGSAVSATLQVRSTATVCRPAGSDLIIPFDSRSATLLDYTVSGSVIILLPVARHLRPTPRSDDALAGGQTW